MALRSKTTLVLSILLSGCCNSQPATEGKPQLAANASSPQARAANVAPVWDAEDRASIAELVKRYTTEPAPKPSPEPAAPVEVRVEKESTASPSTVSAGNSDGSIVGRPLPATRFLDSNGEVVDLKDWIGKKNVVLVIHRGFSGSVCMTCTSQTLAISQNLKAFAERDAHVFFLYPGTRDGVTKFLEAVSEARGTSESLPVDVLLDTDLSVVRGLGIEGDLARPTTIILDKSGVVRFEHVAPNITDRASVPTMLDALLRLQASK